MKSMSKFALASALALGGAMVATPALAQKAAAEQQAPARKFNFTKSAQKALQDLQNAANAGDAATFPTALAAAQAAAKNSDDRYFIGQMQLTYGIKTGDKAVQSEAVNAILASGGAQPDEALKLYRAQADIAINAKDYDRATAAYAEILKATPNDTAVLTNLILIQRERKDYPGAMATVRRAIDASKASGQAVPEAVYRAGLQTALDGKLNAELMPLTRDFLSAYPTPKNWQIALDLYRQGAGTDEALLLDTFRLMRNAKTLERANEYIALADTLARGRFYAEARDVVNEGVSAGKFQANNPSAAAILKEVSPRISSDKSALAGLEGRARSDASGEFALKVADG